MFNKTSIWLLEMIGVLVVFASFIHAAPPLNDSFASPVILSGFPTNYSGSNVDATLEQDEPSPKSMAGDVGASVWFRWTATFTGPVQIDTSGSSFDTILAVWEGMDINRLTEIAFNDDKGEDSTSAVFISTEVGVTYRVAVYSYGNIGKTGPFALNISPNLSSSIEGTVTGPDGTTPMEGINVEAYLWTSWLGGYWDEVSQISTDASGKYSIGGLAPGTYRVKFRHLWGDFLEEFYADGADLDSGTDIIVPAEKTVTGIDASLAKASRIAGVVTGPDGTTPLEGITVSAYRWTNAEGGYWESMYDSDDYTDARGNYSIGGLAAGTYRVGFSDEREGDYIDEFYADGADLDSGADILVPAEKTISGIHASLAKASRIAGVVTGADGTTPLKGISVSAYRWTNEEDEAWDMVSSHYTDASGNYSIGGLAAGSYRVEFLDWEGDYSYEVYADGADLDSGADVLVPREKTVSGINASLAKASRIAGVVTGLDGTIPLEGIDVSVYRWNDAGGGYWESMSDSDDYTDANGNYSIGGLAAGTYRVMFRDSLGDFSTEFYADGADLDSGTDILVPAEKIVTGVDASLAKASRIAGVVTGPDGTTPLEGISVKAYRWTNTEGGYWERMYDSDDYTDASGNYSIGGLAAGTYRVGFSDWREGDYIDEFYADGADLDSGAEIFVYAEKTVTGIDASLAKASHIAGVVTGPERTTPLEDIQVNAYRWTDAGGGEWEWVSGDYTDASGNYSIGGLAAGTYRVEFDDWAWGNFARKIYGDAVVLELGTDIVVPAATIVAGIDASLSKASRIAGTVIGPDGIPLQGIKVKAYSLTNTNSGYPEVASWDFTDTRGNYSIGGLAAGTYRLKFIDDRGNYATKFYANGIDFDSGTDILVPADQIVTGIDVSLVPAIQPQSAEIVSFQLIRAGWFEIRYTGKTGKKYIIQTSDTLGVWTDDSSLTCQSGVNIVRVASSELGMFWRLKEAP